MLLPSLHTHCLFSRDLDILFNLLPSPIYVLSII
jgi:hypothetical protein